MFEYPFDRAFLEKPEQEDEVLTLTGQVITGRSPDGIRKYEFRSDYPIRFQLHELTNCVWHLLEKAKRNAEDVARAALLVREEIWKQVDEIKNFEAEWGIDDANLEGSPYEKTGIPPLRSWAVNSDVDSLLECTDDSFFNSPDWDGSRLWSWSELYLVTALWAIDEAAAMLNAGEVAKAAMWAIRAQRHYGYALSDEWMREQEKQFRSDAARKAAAKRHTENHAMKSQVIEWCSQNLENFRSLDSAASAIAGKLVPAEWRTVRKWITEYRKSLPSARTE